MEETIAGASEPNWETLITKAPQPVFLEAHTYEGKPAQDSFCSPRRVSCSDTEIYYIKGRIAGRPEISRALIAEQVVGRIGAAMGAPVADVELINLPSALVNLNPEIKPIEPGICHGSKEIRKVNSNRQALAFASVPENRLRFSLLTMLYGLCLARDHQFIYSTSPPYVVYSYDHGHFFPQGPDWSPQTIQQIAGEPVTPDFNIMVGCNVTNEELELAAQRLQLLTNDVIAAAVAAPPDGWGFPMAERVILARYLTERRDRLMSMFAPVNS